MNIYKLIKSQGRFSNVLINNELIKNKNELEEYKIEDIEFAKISDKDIEFYFEKDMIKLQMIDKIYADNTWFYCQSLNLNNFLFLDSGTKYIISCSKVVLFYFEFNNLKDFYKHKQNKKDYCEFTFEFDTLFNKYKLKFYDVDFKYEIENNNYFKIVSLKKDILKIGRESYSNIYNASKFIVEKYLSRPGLVNFMNFGNTVFLRNERCEQKEFILSNLVFDILKVDLINFINIKMCNIYYGIHTQELRFINLKGYNNLNSYPPKFKFKNFKVNCSSVWFNHLNIIDGLIEKHNENFKGVDILRYDFRLKTKYKTINVSFRDHKILKYDEQDKYKIQKRTNYIEYNFKELSNLEQLVAELMKTINISIL